MSDFVVVLSLYPGIALTLALIFGLLVGSFLNVVIYRLPKMMEAEWREQCNELLHCSAELNAADEPRDGEPVFNDSSASSSSDISSVSASTTPDFSAATLVPSPEVTDGSSAPELAIELEPGVSNTQEIEAEAKKPEAFNLWVPRSRCPHCGHQITALENIPVISYLFLGGKCAGCRAPISLRYPSIELVTGLLSMAVIYFFGATSLGLAALVFTWCLIALTMIDFDTQLLPDSITLPLVWLGLIVNSFGGFTSLQSALWGAVAGYLILWSIYWLFKLLTGKEGMGYGDFKLLAALGAWMGWEFLPQIILLSSLVGAVIGIALMVIKQRGKDIPIPFGPYLAIAGWIALIWGDHINRQYLLLFVPH